MIADIFAVMPIIGLDCLHLVLEIRIDVKPVSKFLEIDCFDR